MISDRTKHAISLAFAGFQSSFDTQEIFMKIQMRFLWPALVITGLSACGGGGGSDSSTPSPIVTGTAGAIGTTTTDITGTTIIGTTGTIGTNNTGTTGTTTTGTSTSTSTTSTSTTSAAASFPLRAAYGARQLSGFDDIYTVSENCSGTARSTGAKAQATAFEGVAAFGQQLVASTHFTNCSPADSVDNGTFYLDRRAGVEFMPIGFSASDVYGVATAAPKLPDTVKVNDSGDIATFTLYPDIAKGTSVGQRVLSYVIEADTAGGASTGATAIVNFVTRNYNASGALTYTEQARLRINSVGVLTAVSIDAVYRSGLHLVLTR